MYGHVIKRLNRDGVTLSEPVELVAADAVASQDTPLETMARERMIGAVRQAVQSLRAGLSRSCRETAMRSVRVCVWVCLTLGLPAGATAQGRQSGSGARFFRDRAGRVRRERTILGLGAINGGGNMQTITIAPDPATGTAFTLDPTTRTARRVPRIAIPLGANMMVRTTATTVMVQGRGVVAPTGSPIGSSPTDERLGARLFESVRALRRKTTSVIPTGQIGNDRPIEITDERWNRPT